MTLRFENELGGIAAPSAHRQAAPCPSDLFRECGQPGVSGFGG